MAGKDRRRKWKRNCQRMYDRAEHSDSWGVTPAYRTPSSFFLKSYMYFWSCSLVGEGVGRRNAVGVSKVGSWYDRE